MIAVASPQGAPRSLALTPTGSPLALLHPRGYAERVAAWGAALPASLAAAPTAQPRADLVALAPSPAECRRPGWAESLARAVGQLSDDGLLYLMAPAQHRARARRLLLRAGLRPALSLVHVPDIAAGRYLIPLERAALRYALAGAVPSRAATRALLGILLRSPGGLRALHAAGPAIGEAFQRPGAPPPLAWLRGPHHPRPLALGVLGVSHRTDAVTATLHQLDPASGALASLAKVPLNPAGHERLLGEAAAMRQQAAAARQAGARLADAALEAGEPPVLFQSPIEGRPLSSLLAAAPARLPAVAEQVAGWLERYGRETCERRVIDAAWLQSALLTPLAAVAPALPAPYVARVAQLAERFMGQEAPLTAAHNDLTMWNVLLGPGGALGVIDWETAQAATFPLGDLLYGLVDAVAATAHYQDRLAAFRACFARDGAWRPLAWRLHGRLAAALGAEREWRELCFHACWIGHAAAELARGEAGDFAAIARWIGGPGEEALEMNHL